MKSESSILINNYELLHTEGNGNIGSVFKAKKDNKFYAIKMVNKNQLESMDSFYNLMQKIESMDQTGSTNLVKIHEFFQNPLNIFIAMEYCNQGNLLQYMLKQPEKRLDCFKAIELFAHILKGFKFLHFNKIEHRNLKPQNILMHNGKPKISDYGIYMLYNGSENKYQMREFMSPENYQHQTDQVSHLCDIWGLGVLLFFMIFNTWPFKDFQDIRNYTFNKQFDLELFLKEKDIQKPLTLNINQPAMGMLSEIFGGLFVYESKDRMNFLKLCNHEIFLKVKNFDMGESILFYFHQEKNFPSNVANSPPFKQGGGGGTNTFVGLPGVSARSMYSGEALDDIKSNDNNSILISTPLPLKKVHSKKDSNENQENLDAFNHDQSKILTNFSPYTNQQNLHKLPQIPSVTNITNSEFNQESPKVNKHKKKNNEEPFISSFQNDGGFMLSSFGKKNKLETLKQIHTKIDEFLPFQQNPSKVLLESESDFENTEEFDSKHREINSIPYFILKACKMVQFQFKPNQDQNAMKMMDSYSLSSVMSIPRPFNEIDQQKRYISSLYDLEIYRYRFIQHTIHILKNVYQDMTSDLPLIDYGLMIKAEYYALKNSFYIAKTLLQKVEKNENFLKVDSRDFAKYFTQQCHDKYTEILEKDLQRIFTSFYLTQTQLQNQGVEPNIDHIEMKYFYFKRNSVNQLQEENSIDESDNNVSKKGNIQKLQQRQMSQQSTNHHTQQQNTIHTFTKQLHEAHSFTISKTSPLINPQHNQSRIGNITQEHLPLSELNNFVNEETESLKNEIQLDEKHIKDLQTKYNQNLNEVFQKLKIEYEKKEISQEKAVKIVKLALRIAMCIRHTEVFDKSQMEQILILFSKDHVVHQLSNNIINNNNNNNNNNITPQIGCNPNNQMIVSHSKNSSPSLGTSLTNSKVLKKQANSGQMQFSIESLVKWVNYCTKSDALRQICILIKE